MGIRKCFFSLNVTDEISGEGIWREASLSPKLHAWGYQEVGELSGIEGVLADEFGKGICCLLCNPTKAVNVPSAVILSKFDLIGLT